MKQMMKNQPERIKWKRLKNKNNRVTNALPQNNPRDQGKQDSTPKTNMTPPIIKNENGEYNNKICTRLLNPKS